MSNESSTKGSNSRSNSTDGSPNQVVMLRDNSITDLTLFGSPAPVFTRTGTVKRALRKDQEGSLNGEERLEFTPHVRTVGRNSSPELTQTVPDRETRYRRSLDSTYRLSLESISEYKTKSSFSTASLYPESSMSDSTDYAVRSATTNTNREADKTLLSPGSSYLSWIESVHSEFFASATSTTEVTDADNKVGEWNNFWLNYNSARSRYAPSPYPSTSNNDERTADEFSDARSTCSTQKKFNDSLEQITLTSEEVNEVLHCSQRITEILQNAVKRSEHETDESKNDSYYSQPYTQAVSIYLFYLQHKVPYIGLSCLFVG